MMADYAFYTDAYLGTLIPEKKFSSLAQRAGEALERLKRSYRVCSTGQVSENMAICAMAEAIYSHSRRSGGVVAASAGEMSVRYADTDAGDRQLRRELYERAAVYLDIYRGMSR